LRAQLLGGASFSELARKHSDCESAQSGGNLGTICRDSALPEPIIKAAFSQAKSAVGPAIRSRAGYHVIQVLEHNERETLPFEHVKSTLAAHLKEDKTRQQIKTFVAQLKREASIVRFVRQ
jgi:peptidyl-prolyl cis-trans isomerase C